MTEQDGNADLLVHPTPEAAAEALVKDLDVLHDPRAKAADKAASAERLGGSSGGEEAVHALLGALHHPSPQVRGAAAFALGRLGDLHGVGPLVTLLEDPVYDVRCRAAVALGLIGSVSVLRTTSEADAEERAIRCAAIEALGNLGAVAVECLTKALRYGPPSERARVVIALGETRDVSAVGPLSEVLDDDDEHVRTRAREALEKIRESRVF